MRNKVQEVTLKDGRGGSVTVTVETCTEQTKEKDQQQSGQGGLRATTDSCILTVGQSCRRDRMKSFPGNHCSMG